MAKISNQFLTTGILCAVIAVVLTAQGCQKAVSVPPKIDSGKETAAAERSDGAKAESAKPADRPTSTTEPAASKTPASPKKPVAGKTSASSAAVAPKATPLPAADIDSHDPKYADGKPPKIEADGKPVTLLYLPPHMFSAIITRGGQEKAYLTFGTFSVTGDKGDRLELHVLARQAKPDGSKFERVALIESNKVKKGQSWTASAAGMNHKIEVMGFGEWGDSPFAGSGMGWIKLKVSVK